MPNWRAVRVEPRAVVVDEGALGRIRADAADGGHVKPHHAGVTAPVRAPGGSHIFSSW